MDGTTHARRNAGELVTARLIACAVLRRSGGSWDEHPLSQWPDETRLDIEGRPTFVYWDDESSVLRAFYLRPGEPVADQAWRSEPPSILVDGFVSDEMIARTAYAETGALLGFEVVAR